jgi:hypothetical protein
MNSPSLPRTWSVLFLFLVIGMSPLFAQEPFRIERSTVLTSSGEYHWSQSRGAIIPGDRARVMITTQQVERRGSHGYRDIYVTETTDGLSQRAAGRTQSRAAGQDHLGTICKLDSNRTGHFRLGIYTIPQDSS